MLVFEERGKPEYPEKNLSEQSREPTNSAHETLSPGIEPGPHWWKASALTLCQPCSHVNEWEKTRSVTYSMDLKLA